MEGRGAARNSYPSSSLFLNRKYHESDLSSHLPEKVIEEVQTVSESETNLRLLSKHSKYLRGIWNELEKSNVKRLKIFKSRTFPSSIIQKSGIFTTCNPYITRTALTVEILKPLKTVDGGVRAGVIRKSGGNVRNLHLIAVRSRP